MERFRASLRGLIPEGWSVRESIELVSPQQSAYVAAAADFLPAGTTIEQYAEQLGTELRERLPGFEEIALEQTGVPGGSRALIRRFRWRPPDGEPVMEIQRYTLENGRGIVCAARATERTFAEHESQLQQLLAGIGVGVPAPLAGVLRRDESRAAKAYEAFEAGQIRTNTSKAFGFEGANGDAPARSDHEAAKAWNDVRTSWQQVREEI
jgi:hypothetical protein